MRVAVLLDSFFTIWNVTSAEDVEVVVRCAGKYIVGTRRNDGHRSETRGIP